MSSLREIWQTVWTRLPLAHVDGDRLEHPVEMIKGDEQMNG